MPSSSLLIAIVLSSLPGFLRAQERTAFVGATVHTMVEGESPRPLTILVEGDRIRTLSPSLELAPGTRQIDVSGKHIVPGLIDAYTHFDPDHDALYTAVGITTVRDVGGDRLRLILTRRTASRNRVPGPTLLTAGALVGGEPPVTPQAVSLRNEHSAEEFLPILFADEIDFLSIHPGLPHDAWRKAIELAHQAELQVWGPLPTNTSLVEAVSAGQDGFHFLDGLLPKGVGWDIVQMPALDIAIKTLADAGRGVVPLLVVNATRLENQGTGTDQLALLGLLDPNYESWWKAELVGRIEGMSSENAARGQRILEKQLALTARLAKAGVPLVPGSAGAQPWLFPGQALHRELALWVRAGMGAEEVLWRATRGAAGVLGIEKERGALFAGAAADLVCVDADPRLDLATLLDPAIVCVRGRVLERRDLADLLQTVAADKRATRETLALPMALEAPPGPRTFGDPGEQAVAEGDALVLDGILESVSLGQRLSGERFQVWQLSDGRTAYCGRILYPAAREDQKRQVQVVQVVKDGQLESSYVTLSQAGMQVVARGLWAARTWRMSTKLNGQPLTDNTSIPIHPRCVDVSSVTSLLILGQSALGHEIPIVHLREGLEGELVNWISELDDNGDHQLQTPLGPLAFRLNANGAPERVVQRRGGGVIETILSDFTTFGGAGHPLPAEKRKVKAAAEAAASADEDPTRDEPAAEEAATGDGQAQKEDGR